MTRVVVAGAAGRMGATSCAAIDAADDLELAGRVDPSLGVELADTLGNADVVVDFTTPDAAPANIAACLDAGVHAVVGTTGFDLDAVRAKAEASGGEARVLVVPNFAIGAVLMMRFAAEAARHMPEAEIVELHHDRKLDKPSGTAARTAELIAQGRGTDVAVPGPDDSPARGLLVHGVPVHSVRLPGLVAHQEVVFGGEGQTLTLRHDSIDRSSFMPGVLLAVKAVSGRPGMTVGLEALL